MQGHSNKINALKNQSNTYMLTTTNKKHNVVYKCFKETLIILYILAECLTKKVTNLTQKLYSNLNISSCAQN